MSSQKIPLSLNGLLIMQALVQGHLFGFDIMNATGLPSGTIYPALRRLEALDLITSEWEDESTARKKGRPRRRYYELTPPGRRYLREAERRIGALGRLLPKGSTA